MGSIQSDAPKGTIQERCYVRDPSGVVVFSDRTPVLQHISAVTSTEATLRCQCRPLPQRNCPVVPSRSAFARRTGPSKVYLRWWTTSGRFWTVQGARGTPWDTYWTCRGCMRPVRYDGPHPWTRNEQWRPLLDVIHAMHFNMEGDTDERSPLYHPTAEGTIPPQERDPENPPMDSEKEVD